MDIMVCDVCVPGSRESLRPDLLTKLLRLNILTLIILLIQIRTEHPTPKIYLQESFKDASSKLTLHAKNKTPHVIQEKLQTYLNSLNRYFNLRGLKSTSQNPNHYLFSKKKTPSNLLSWISTVFYR